MHTKRSTVWLWLLIMLPPILGYSQTAYYSLNRYCWVSQAQTLIVPLMYQFDASVSGANLDWVDLIGPASESVLTGNSINQSLAMSYPLVGTNLASGLTNLNANYPVGDYQLIVESASTNNLTGRTSIRTNRYAVALTNDFADPAPILISPLPPASLTTTQTFLWTAFSAPTGSYTSLYVMEGSFDESFIQSILSSGLSALTNFSWKVACPGLPATQASVVATNLDPAMDHIVWLEFHVTSPQPIVPLNDVGSVTVNLSVFPGMASPTPPFLSAVMVSDSQIVQLTATGHPGYVYSIEAVDGAADGEWQVIGSLVLDQSGTGVYTDSSPLKAARIYRLFGPK